MDEFLEWYYTNNRKLPVAVLAALTHYQFVYIHPFFDGNGRTARLLMNLVLMQKGYPPAVILNAGRLKYYRVLKEAELDDNNGSFRRIYWKQKIITELQALPGVRKS